MTRWMKRKRTNKISSSSFRIVVHEMVHFLERKHNDVFMAYMNEYLPKWRSYKDELNRLAVKHENWNY